MRTRSRLKCAMPSVSVLAAAVMSSPAMGNELMGYKGDRLKGSISCVHPNVIDDLTERIGEAENYTVVLRVYIQQGYCLADIPTILT